MIDLQKKSVSYLKKRAWKPFSIFIRKRDKGKCYTCGDKRHWKKQQAGHLISCTCEELRFNEDNVHCQCVSCNIFKGGNLVEYVNKFIKEYGIGYYNALMRIKHQSNKHWKPQELIDIIEKYEGKLKTAHKD